MRLLIICISRLIWSKTVQLFLFSRVAFLFKSSIPDFAPLKIQSAFRCNICTISFIRSSVISCVCFTKWWFLCTCEQTWLFHELRVPFVCEQTWLYHKLMVPLRVWSALTISRTHSSPSVWSDFFISHHQKRRNDDLFGNKATVPVNCLPILLQLHNLDFLLIILQYSMNKFHLLVIVLSLLVLSKTRKSFSGVLCNKVPVTVN